MWKDDGFLHDCLYCFTEQRGTDRACLHAGLFDPAADKLIFFILAVKCFTVMCVREDIRRYKKVARKVSLFYISDIIFRSFSSLAFSSSESLPINSISSCCFSLRLP